jgi:hypothetical protein
LVRKAELHHFERTIHLTNVGAAGPKSFNRNSKVQRFVVLISQYYLLPSIFIYLFLWLSLNVHAMLIADFAQLAC